MENKGMAEGSELDPFMYSKRKVLDSECKLLMVIIVNGFLFCYVIPIT